MKQPHPSLLATLLAMLLAVTSGVAQPIPDLMTKQSRFGDLLWVSAQEAAPDAALRRELFSELALQPLDHLIADSEALAPELMRAALAGQVALASLPCGSWQIEARKPLEPIGLDTLLAGSEVALEGVVRGARAGFLYGRVATLLEVEVTRLLKAPDGTGAVEKALVAYGGGRVLLGDRLLCRRSSRRDADPVVGGRILIFADRAHPGEPLMVGPRDAGLFYETATGEVSTPFAGPGWRAIEQQLEALDKDRNQRPGGGR